MVLIKDENLPPRCWLMGRIIETHPDPDGLVRVATIRTTKGEIKRPITKICLLLEAEEDNGQESDSNEESEESKEQKPDAATKNNSDSTEAAEEKDKEANEVKTDPPKKSHQNLR